MDHVTDMQMADLVDGILPSDEEALIVSHVLSCQRCFDVSVSLNQYLHMPLRVPLLRQPEYGDLQVLPLAADSGGIHPLSSTDRSIEIKFRRPRVGGPLKAYLVSGKDMLARGPKLVLPKHPDGFVFLTDGTVELPGVEAEELAEGSLEFPLEQVGE